MNNNSNNKIPKRDYSDIINCKHYVSPVHPQMSNIDRAAQFAPFAALRGFDDAIDETAAIAMIDNEDYLD